MAGPNVQLPLSPMFTTADGGGVNPNLDTAAFLSTLQKIGFYSTRSGTTANRPSATSDRWIGMPYFDTQVSTTVFLQSTNPDVWSTPLITTTPAVSTHNDLGGLQGGGSTTQFYHLPQSAYDLFSSASLSTTAFTGTSAGYLDLGAGDRGMQRLFMDYVDSATVGNVTINRAAGSGFFANNTTGVVVTNNLVTASTKVFAQLARRNTGDNSMHISAIAVSSGVFRLFLGSSSGVPTGSSTPFYFFIVNTDS